MTRLCTSTSPLLAITVSKKNILILETQEHRNLPWRRLLTSKPAWACGITVIGSQWADATLMLGVTKYLKLVYGFSIEYVTKTLSQKTFPLLLFPARHSAVPAPHWPLFRCYYFRSCRRSRQTVRNCFNNDSKKIICLPL